MITEHKDFNLKVSVRNAHILRAIREHHDSVAQFCRDFKLSHGQVSALVTMREKPHNQQGELRAVAEDLCSALGKTASELWPRDMAEMKAKRATVEIEISQAEAMAMAQSQDKRMIQRETIKAISENLTDRQVDVLSMRYDEGLTYSQMADRMGVTTERARQIELKAIKKMKDRAGKLRVDPAELR